VQDESNDRPTLVSYCRVSPGNLTPSRSQDPDVNLSDVKSVSSFILGDRIFGRGLPSLEFGTGARITFAYWSVFSTMSLAKSAGEPIV
jgi:hypothetical protein